MGLKVSKSTTSPNTSVTMFSSKSRRTSTRKDLLYQEVEQSHNPSVILIKFES